MRFMRHALSGLFLVGVTLALLVWAGALVTSAVEERMAREPRAPQVRERIFAVNVVEARAETITPDLVTFGEVQSRRTLDVRAATGGTVVALSDNFVEGGRVRTGELLVQIDPKDAELALERVQSDLADAEAEGREADRALLLARDELAAAEDQEQLRAKALERQRQLGARGVGTAANEESAELALSSARQAVLSRRQALAQAEARVDQAATRLARTRIAMAEAERRLDDLVIRAGFDGTLSGVTLVEGGLVSANALLGQLVDDTALEVAFRVSTAQYARLLDEAGALTGANVRVTLDVFGTDLVAQGTLSRDSAAVGEGQTGRLLFARLGAAPGFKPGDFVTVTVAEPPLDRVARLPASALNAADQVLVVGEGERLETLQVRLMRRQGDDVLVRGRGLTGRLVVAERTPVLGAGIRVRPLTPEAADAPPAEAEMVELSDERRARIKAFVEGNTRMPDQVKQRILSQLAEPRVPAAMVQRIEARMGG